MFTTPDRRIENDPNDLTTLSWTESFQRAVDSNEITAAEIETLRDRTFVFTFIGSTGDVNPALNSMAALLNLNEVIQNLNIKTIAYITEDSRNYAESLGLLSNPNCKIEIVPINYSKLLIEKEAFFDSADEKDRLFMVKKLMEANTHVAESVIPKIANDIRELSNTKFTMVPNGLSLLAYAPLIDEAIRNGASAVEVTPYVNTPRSRKADLLGLPFLNLPSDQNQHLYNFLLPRNISNNLYQGFMQQMNSDIAALSNNELNPGAALNPYSKKNNFFGIKYDFDYNYQQLLQRVGTIYAYPKYLSNPWSSHDDYTGPIGISPDRVGNLNEEVSGFLEKHNNNVITIATGSMIMRYRERFIRNVLSALPEGTNVLCVGGWDANNQMFEQVAAENNKINDALFTPFAPYSKLFSNVKLGILSGGAGAFTSALKSFMPTLITYSIPDQNFHMQSARSKGYPIDGLSVDSLVKSKSEEGAIARMTRAIEGLLDNKSTAKAQRFYDRYQKPLDTNLATLPHVALVKAIARQVSRFQ